MLNSRIVFFDNLRYFLAVSIIIFHAALAYSSHPWWPVSENEKSKVAEWIMVFLGSFTMPFFFYIAGYFALPVIMKNGAGTFIKKKITRLGLPWLVCVLTICPVLPFIYHFTRNGFTIPMNYSDFWIMLQLKGLNFNIGFISSMKELMDTNGFYLRYMWFLSLLLLFFIIFAAVYKTFKKQFQKEVVFQEVKMASTSLTIKIFLGVGFLTFFGSFILVMLMKIFAPDVKDLQPLFTLFNIIQFNITGIFPFVVYFVMGIITYRQKWIERKIFPGNSLVWTISLPALTILYIILYEKMLTFRIIYKDVPTQPIEIVVGMSLFVLSTFITISAVGFFTYCMQKFSNRSNANLSRVSSFAYELYLGHYIFVILFQLAAFTITGIPVLVKFIIVSIASIFCTHAAAIYLIKPRPRLTTVLVFIMLAAMMLFIKQ